MSTPYGISTSKGSMSYDNYVNTPIFGPLNTNRYPCAIPYHNYGTLIGIRPTPPFFYSSQEPVNSDQFTNSRQQYFRTAESVVGLAKQRERAILSAGQGMYSSNSSKYYNVSNHLNYIQPIDCSLQIQKKRALAVGKSSYKIGLPNEAPISTKNYYPSGKRSTIRRVRSGGCVAPKKKGAIENYSLKNAQVCAWGSLPRQNY
jgi:hypothetical protein